MKPTRLCLKTSLLLASLPSALVHADGATSHDMVDVATETLMRAASSLQQVQSPAQRAPRQFLLESSTASDPNSLYVQYGANDLSRDASAVVDEFTQRSEVAFTGGEYRLSPQWTGGLRYGRTEQTLQFENSHDELKHEGNAASLYAQWFKNGFTATGLLGYAKGRLQVDRQLNNISDNNSGNESNIASGKADTRQRYASIAGQYAFRKGGWIYGPFSRYDASESTIGEYTETSEGLETNRDSQDINTRIFSMGVHAAYVFNSSAGTLTPFVSLMTRRELAQHHETIVKVQDSSATSMVMQAPLDDRWEELSLGMTLALQKQLLITTSLERSLDLDQQRDETLFVRADWILQGI